MTDSPIPPETCDPSTCSLPVLTGTTPDESTTATPPNTGEPVEVARQADAAGGQIRALKKESPKTARKAAAQLAIFTALSMLIGALVAAAAGALGGAHRDEGWGYPRL